MGGGGCVIGWGLGGAEVRRGIMAGGDEVVIEAGERERGKVMGVLMGRE